MTGPELWIEHAPAKVNLDLHILGPREDGYHELDSLIMALEWGDELRALETSTGTVELLVGGPAASADVPKGEANLVWRMARAALGRGRELGLLDESQGLSLHLEKRIPSRAGLGGGSSDAAACLRAVEGLWQLDLGAEWARRELAAAGADCVFFLDPGPAAVARCRGIGACVEALPGQAPPWSVLLVTPEVTCSTPEVFRAWQGSSSAAPERGPGLDGGLLRDSLADVRRRLVNDLEAAALRVEPSLAEWRALFDDEDLGHARLCGSGSSFFALFSDESQAARELEGLKRAAAARGLATRLACVTAPKSSRAR